MTLFPLVAVFKVETNIISRYCVRKGFGSQAGKALPSCFVTQGVSGNDIAIFLFGKQRRMLVRLGGQGVLCTFNQGQNAFINPPLRLVSLACYPGMFPVLSFTIEGTMFWTIGQVVWLMRHINILTFNYINVKLLTKPQRITNDVDIISLDTSLIMKPY